jgi:hypothetical protein
MLLINLVRASVTPNKTQRKNNEIMERRGREREREIASSITVKH